MDILGLLYWNKRDRELCNQENGKLAPAGLEGRPSLVDDVLFSLAKTKVILVTVFLGQDFN